VRQVGDELRKYKKQLGHLVSLEMGKIAAEGEGEVQEFIDICDFAVGLSRSMAGKVFPSERALVFAVSRWRCAHLHISRRSRPLAHGAVESVRCCWRDFRFQLSCGRLRVERCSLHDLRQQHCVEGRAFDASLQRRHDQDYCSRAGAQQPPGCHLRARPGRHRRGPCDGC
jgi:hypothetical protein